MTHNSRLFGEFTYNPGEVITFTSGLLGFKECKDFVLKSSAETNPIIWLLSVEEGGPELALIDPKLVREKYSLDNVVLDEGLLEKLRCETPSSVLRLAIVTLPDNIRHMSMNLRTPVFIDRKSRRGIEYPKPGLEKRPVRCNIYGELIGSPPAEDVGTLVMLRKENETVNIGDDITIHIMDFVNGGVRLGITAPKRLRVSRGDSKATPLLETKRANEHMNLKYLTEIMRMYRVMKESQDELEATLLQTPEDMDKAV